MTEIAPSFRQPGASFCAGSLGCETPTHATSSQGQVDAAGVGTRATLQAWMQSADAGTDEAGMDDAGAFCSLRCTFRGWEQGYGQGCRQGCRQGYRQRVPAGGCPGSAMGCSPQGKSPALLPHIPACCFPHGAPTPVPLSRRWARMQLWLRAAEQDLAISNPLLNSTTPNLQGRLKGCARPADALGCSVSCLTPPLSLPGSGSKASKRHLNVRGFCGAERGQQPQPLLTPSLSLTPRSSKGPRALQPHPQPGHKIKYVPFRSRL